MIVIIDTDICQLSLSNLQFTKMVSWSALGRTFGTNLFKNNITAPYLVKNVNFSVGKALNGDHGHRVMAMQPSRYNVI